MLTSTHSVEGAGSGGEGLNKGDQAGPDRHFSFFKVHPRVTVVLEFSTVVICIHGLQPGLHSSSSSSSLSASRFFGQAESTFSVLAFSLATHSPLASRR